MQSNEINSIMYRTKISPNGCIEWMGYKLPFGYGRISRKGVFWLVHRYLWFLINGNIPKGMCVLHHCDNPSCLNIDHLFLGTQGDNLQDMYNKNRHIRLSLKGEKNGISKLKTNHIYSIRQDNRPQTVIAKEYNVSQSTIQRVKSYQSWSHV